MKFTYSWLRDHLETALNPNQIAEKLTSLGIEVEEIIDYSQVLQNIIVGKILIAEQHPNADKLRVCQVDIGTDKPLNIVCGASNARAGICVAVAQVGAIIPATKTVLRKGTIRGVESQGMMCSSEELTLDNDDIDGIMEFPNTVTVGQPVSLALDLEDIILDVSITPNRADCFSVRGIARDLASAGYGRLLNIPELNLKKLTSLEPTIDNSIELILETTDCDYFSTLAIKSFAGKTPNTIAKRLKLIGQKLISCPVDIANYICFDIGQPMHIFDLDKLPSKLYIRSSTQGETLKTLSSGKVETLPNGGILVASDKEPLSLAGIIGGESTAVSAESGNLLVESSYFNKMAITKVGQALHISTDARTRFERGTDPNNVELSIKYFILLLSMACPNIQVSQIKHVGQLPNNKFDITLHYWKFHDLTNLSQEEFSKAGVLLNNLGCEIKLVTQDSISVTTPSWRHDLHIEEDLIEEILRLIGFDKIHETPLAPAEPIVHEYIKDKLIDALVYNGYFEVKTFSLVDQMSAELFTDNNNIVKISDVLSNEFAVLRPTLINSHLKSVLQAQNKSQDNLKIVEIGKQFHIQNKTIIETNMLTGTVSEINPHKHWLKQRALSIFDIKADVERLINMLLPSTRISNKAPIYYHPGRSASYIYQKDTIVAQFGEIHPSILDKLEIKGKVISFEIFLEKIPEITKRKQTLFSREQLVLSQYQAITRDFSFILDKLVTADQLLNCIKKLHINELKDINIFDVYESTTLGDNKKAIAFEVLLQSNKATLTDSEIQNISKKIVGAISKNYNGILRDS